MTLPVRRHAGIPIKAAYCKDASLHTAACSFEEAVWLKSWIAAKSHMYPNERKQLFNHQFNIFLQPFCNMLSLRTETTNKRMELEPTLQEILFWPEFFCDSSFVTVWFSRPKQFESFGLLGVVCFHVFPSFPSMFFL